MKKINFSKFKWNGQFLLLLTNALLLVAILANYSLAINGISDVERKLASEDLSKASSSNLIKNNAFSDDRFVEPLLGEIAIFGGNFAPRGWALCDGQLLPIAQNTALFSLLGTSFGGDGRTTFGLPDLRGRVPIHSGQGAGLPQVRLGQKNNAEMVMPYFDKKYNPVLPPSTQGVHYIIALQGAYPSRN